MYKVSIMRTCKVSRSTDVRNHALAQEPLLALHLHIELRLAAVPYNEPLRQNPIYRCKKEKVIPNAAT